MAVAVVGSAGYDDVVGVDGGEEGLGVTAVRAMVAGEEDVGF